MHSTTEPKSTATLTTGAAASVTPATPMPEMAIIGLGRMGGGMVRRLVRSGHTIVAYNRSPEKTLAIAAEGAIPALTLEELVAALPAPRAVWLMLPSGDTTEQHVGLLADLLEPGDLVIDGGNSRFTDSQRRAATFGERGIHFVDAGVSGGIWGLREGFCIMAGGASDDIERILPLLTDLVTEGGFAHVGPVGAGHFTKMVHNGVEYGMMQAYGEGYELLAASELGIDTGAALGVWQHGSVVRSWLLDLLVAAMTEDPGLTRIRGVAADSGEGRWTVEEAIRLGVPAPVASAALFARFASRQEDSPALKVVAALRNQFGGHAVEIS
jgi:6-phosphogluconate dehydrogenase